MPTVSRVLGHTVARAADLLRPVVTPATDLSDARTVADLFALTAFAALVEPGDTDANLLVETLGPLDTALAVAREIPIDPLLDRMRAAIPDDPLPSRDRLTSALERWRARLDRSDPVRVLEMAAHLGARLIPPADPLWPPGLDDLERGRPLSLWIRGDPNRLSGLTRSLAMVGARAASGYGTHVALESAAALSDRGFAIVSGGAYGIDAAAHRATLASNQLTIAFLAGGVDRLYPTGNSALLQKIIANGLVIGELPPGSAPTRWRFLMRNRLIAAASQATIVIEAGRRSGSLNTAGHAAQLGRPIGAVPGPVTSPESEGCHRLIREYDATCVTSADEMAELCDPFASPTEHTPPDTPTDRILRELGFRSGRTIPDLQTRTGCDTRTLQSELGRLEALGEVREEGDGWRKNG